MITKEDVSVLVIGIMCVVAVIVCTCIPSTPKKHIAQSYPVVVENDTLPPEVHRVIEFGYNGHDYIEFVTRGGHCTIVHSPDCHCQDDMKDVVDKMQNDYYD